MSDKKLKSMTIQELDKEFKTMNDDKRIDETLKRFDEAFFGLKETQNGCHENIKSFIHTELKRSNIEAKIEILKEIASGTDWRTTDKIKELKQDLLALQIESKT